jgi:hypothetical protein
MGNDARPATGFWLTLNILLLGNVPGRRCKREPCRKAIGKDAIIRFWQSPNCNALKLESARGWPTAPVKRVDPGAPEFFGREASFSEALIYLKKVIYRSDNRYGYGSGENKETNNMPVKPRHFYIKCDHRQKKYYKKWSIED